MTFFHFVNCASLALLPPFIIFRSSSLSKYDSYQTVISAAVFYLITQLAKMMIAASIVPTSDNEEYEFDPLQELFKVIISVLDIYGMKYAFSRARLESEVKPFAVGLGWAAADAFATKAAPLYVGARSMEFDWTYLALAVEANINIIAFISLARLVWLSGRTSFDKAYLPILNAALYGFGCVPFLAGLTKWALGGCPFYGTAVLGLLSAAYFVTSGNLLALKPKREHIE